MDSSLPGVSIIIPCYNSGAFLPDALESVGQCETKNVEVIIVDDGSTDKETLELLDSLAGSEYKVLKQKNGGPAAARNTGVKVASAEFILFLDSDNMIKENYISKALELFKNNPELGVVYGNPDFFGDVTDERLFESKPFNLTSILLGNYIDVCAVVRKSAWESVGGLDESRLIIGYEDWDFWIMLGKKGWHFHHINEKLFQYRIRKNSLIKQVTEQEYIARMFEHIYQKHWRLLLDQFEALYYQFQFYQADKEKPIRTFFKNVKNKYLSTNSESPRT